MAAHPSPPHPNTIPTPHPTPSPPHPAPITQSMGYGASDAKIAAIFGPLDDKLAAVLAAEHMKLLSAAWLAATDLERLPCRQDLEAREANGERPFLSAKAAVAALRRKRREMAALSYGWGSSGEPDPSGEYLVAVRAFLRGREGRHVVGLFWDFGSLFQNQPPRFVRSEPQGAAFKAALAVMGDAYASVLGVTVIRHSRIPARPAAMDGKVVVFDAPEAADEAAVAAALGEFGGLEGCERVQPGQWCARFDSHAAAEAAAAGA